jgi:tetratricopeptide (TPR) repeat protein
MKEFMKKLLFLLFFTLAFMGARLAAQSTSPTGGAQSQASVRRPPQAKTQQEFKDYNTAYALSGGAEMEKAANDFALKYPESELRPYLYAKAMHEYQNENNPAKMLATGEKVLQVDPDNSVALVLTATVLADNLNDSDQDRQQKIDEIKKNSARALQTMDSAFVSPANASPEQITAYKSTLQSMAHSALGIMALKSGDDASAEKELKAAAGLNSAAPDPYVWYHLALAQDHQKKYDEALASINQALQHTASNADLGRLAQGERERLLVLTKAGSAPQPQPPK